MSHLTRFCFPRSPASSGPSLMRGVLIPSGDAAYGRILFPIPLSSHGFPPAEPLVQLMDPELAFSFSRDSEPSNEPMSRQACLGGRDYLGNYRATFWQAADTSFLNLLLSHAGPVEVNLILLSMHCHRTFLRRVVTFVLN